MKHNTYKPSAKLPSEIPSAETAKPEDLSLAEELQDEPLEIVFAEDVKSRVRTETEPHEPVDLRVSETLEHKPPES